MRFYKIKIKGDYTFLTLFNEKNTLTEDSVCAPVCRVSDVIPYEQSACNERSELSVTGNVSASWDLGRKVWALCPG